MPLGRINRLVPALDSTVCCSRVMAISSGKLTWRAPSASAGTCTRSAKEKGQALIEMALVLPLILVFLLVIVDFGFAFDRREVIQHAVREGARRAAVGAMPSNVVNTRSTSRQGAI